MDDSAGRSHSAAPEPPTLLPWGEGYVVEWQISGVRCEVARIYEDKAAFWVELTWYEHAAAGWDELEGGGRVNLLIQTSRAGAAKGMQGLGLAGVDWLGMHEQLAKAVVRRHREGEPSVELWDVDTSSSVRYLVKPFVVEGETVVFYGDAGAGKSMLAEALAISLATGADFADSYPVSGGGPVLYLDWETSKETHARRLRRLCAPIGIEKPKIRYRRMSGGLADQVGPLRGEIDRYGIKVVIVDSLGWATADEPQAAAAAIRVMDATRRLGVSTICLAHVTKASRERGGKSASIFGSAFYEAAARLTWEVRGKTDSETGDKTLTLYNRKFNEGRMVREPIGLGINYGGGYDTPISIRGLVLTDANRPGTSIADRITQYLTRVGRATYADIATATGASDTSVRLAVNRKPDEFRKRELDGKTVIELCAEAIPGMETSAEQAGMFSGTRPEDSCSVCDQPLTCYDEQATPFCDLHRPATPKEG